MVLLKNWTVVIFYNNYCLFLFSKRGDLMEISFKKRLLSIISVITLTIPLIPVIPTYAWIPIFSNRDPDDYGYGMIGNYLKIILGATELDRITFVDSLIGENAFPPFFVSSQQI